MKDIFKKQIFKDTTLISYAKYGESAYAQFVY